MSSISDVVREARVKGYDEAIREQLALWSKGEITQEEFQQRRDALQQAHLEWAKAAEKRDWRATSKERREAVAALQAGKRQQAQVAVESLLPLFQRGEISEEELVVGKRQIEQQQREAYRRRYIEPPQDIELISRYEVVSRPTPEITAVSKPEPEFLEGQTITLTLEEAVAQGYITEREAQLRRSTAYRQAYDEAYEKALKAAGGADVQYDPERGVFFWYAEQEPEEFSLAPFPPELKRGPKEGSLAHTVTSKFSKILEKTEEAFTSVTAPLVTYTRKQEEESLKIFREGKPWEGFAAYSRGIASYFAITTFEGLTFFVRPVMWGRTTKGILALATKKEAQTQLRSVVAADPFKFAIGIAGGITGGYVFGKGVSKISDVVLGKQTRITRLEDLDFEVEYIRTKWRISGKHKRVPSKYLFPEEFDELAYADEMMGVLEGKKVSIAGKLKTTEGFVDDALEAIKRKTKAELETKGIPEFEAQLLGRTDEIIVTGKELGPKIEIETFPEKTLVPQKFLYEALDMDSTFLDEIIDTTILAKSEDVALFQKDLTRSRVVGEIIERGDELTDLMKSPLLEDIINIEIDRIIRKEGLVTFEKVGEKKVFGGLYYSEGKILGLETGKHKFDVKAGFAKIDDVLEDIRGIEKLVPEPGEPTPWRVTHRQPGFTAPTGKLENILKHDIEIAKELTRGLSPIAKITEAPISAKGMGITGVSVGITPRVKVLSMAVRKEHEAIKSFQSFVSMTTPIQRLTPSKKELQVQPPKITQEVKPLEIQQVDQILKVDTEPISIQKERPIPIPRVLQTVTIKPIEETLIKPISITSQITIPPLKLEIPVPISPIIFPIKPKTLRYFRPPRVPRRRKKRRDIDKDRELVGLLEVRIDPLKMKGINKRNSLKEVLKF